MCEQGQSLYSLTIVHLTWNTFQVVSMVSAASTTLCSHYLCHILLSDLMHYTMDCDILVPILQGRFAGAGLRCHWMAAV